MDDPIKAIFVLIGWFCIVAGTGAAFTAGVAWVGRSMKWAPINIIVNLNRDLQ